MCERNTFNITGVVTGGDHTDIGSRTICGPYTLAPCAHQMKPFTEYPECSISENSTPSLSACSESSHLKAYRDDKQKNSLSTVEGIQQVSRSRQYSRRGSDSAVRCGRTLRIYQIVNTNRSIIHISSIIVARRPVYVKLALWFLHHPAWVEGHTGGTRLTPTEHLC